MMAFTEYRPEMDLLEPRHRTDPYTIYAALRAGPPLRRSVLGYWIAARYSEVSSILKDKRFVASRQAAFPETVEKSGNSERWQAQVMPYLAIADHDLVRRQLQPYFSKQQTDARTPVIRRIADDVVRQAARETAIDLVRDVAVPMTRRVIATTVGIPLGTGDAARWDFALSRTPDPLVGDRGPGRRPVEAIRALEDIVASALDNPDLPGESVLRGLQNAVCLGEMRRELAVANGAFLLAAGYETTMTWITNAAYCLLQRSERWEQLRSGDVPVADAVEEALRLETPVQITTRVATAPVVVSGQSLTAGDAVWLLMGSANRDESIFADASQYTPGRASRPVLAFGGGAYYCVGALMAAREARVALESLIAALPEMTLSSKMPPDWNKTVMMRSLHHLWVERHSYRRAV